MNTFKNKRHWLGAVGRSDYVVSPDNTNPKAQSTKYHSNQAIRVSKQGDLSISVPPHFRAQWGLDRNTSWLTIGTVKYNHGWNNILDAMANGRSITYHIQWIDEDWHLVAELQLSPVKGSSKVARLGSFDTNNGHLDVSVLDVDGNKVGTSHTLDGLTGKTARELVQQAYKIAADAGCTAMAMEDLRGLQRNCARGRGGALNRVVTSIPSGVLRREARREAEERGWAFFEVDAAGTSENVPQWEGVVDCASSHQIASYLIGRRALGHGITRVGVRALSHCQDSGSGSGAFDLSVGDGSGAGDLAGIVGAGDGAGFINPF